MRRLYFYLWERKKVEYKTVLQQAGSEFVERKSRFIGHVKPVSTEEDAIAFIQQKKSEYWDASHNVYAYILREGQIRRYSDDGEPQGTAGIPVLDVLLKSEVTDVVAVVTRYFGGILLGTGGLVRAYSHGASIALEQAKILTMRLCNILRIICDYNQYGRVSSLISECGGFIDDSQFTEAVTIEFHMSENVLGIFEKKLADITSGQVKSQILGEKFFSI